jgi:arylsulfatase A-like enzyme
MQYFRWLLVIGFLFTPQYIQAAEKAKPNVLMIAVDDLNHWVTHLGRNPQAKTPNIDRLAKMGVTFTHAYCAAPACEPSRCALLSGRRPWTSGCYVNGDTWKEHQKPGEGLSAQFLKAGYDVIGSGKIYHGDQFYAEEWSEYMKKQKNSAHERSIKKDEGFHDPLEHDLKDEDLNDYQTVDFCIEKLSHKSDKPFFLTCGLHKPHLPFAVPRKYYDMFPLETIELPPYRSDDLLDIPAAGVKMAGPKGDHRQFVSEGNWKNAIQSYLATCAYCDMNIGRLLDAFDQCPDKANTIVLLWGDHGWSFGEKDHWRKFALWEEPTRAPLIWVVPGVTTPNTRCERTVDFMTIYPTLCDLAGIEIPAHVEGHSIARLLKKPDDVWNEPAICTHGFKNHAVRTENWRYIRYQDGSEELYDEQQDPYEWTNLAGKPEHASTIAELSAMLPDNSSQIKVPAKGKKKADVLE